MPEILPNSKKNQRWVTHAIVLQISHGSISYRIDTISGMKHKRCPGDSDAIVSFKTAPIDSKSVYYTKGML